MTPAAAVCINVQQIFLCGTRTQRQTRVKRRGGWDKTRCIVCGGSILSKRCFPTSCHAYATYWCGCARVWAGGGATCTLGAMYVCVRACVCTLLCSMCVGERACVCCCALCVCVVLDSKMAGFHSKSLCFSGSIYAGNFSKSACAGRFTASDA